MNKDSDNSGKTKDAQQRCNCNGCRKKPVNEREFLDGLCHCGDCNGYGDRW